MTFLRAGDKAAAMHIYLCRGFRSLGISEQLAVTSWATAGSTKGAVH